MTAAWGGEFEAQDGTWTQIAMVCDHCQRLSVATAPIMSTSGFEYQSFDWMLNQLPDDMIEWYPLAGASPDFPDVPAHIARAAREAHASANIKSYMSAVLMARTVVEATAKAKDIKTGNLFEKIDELASNGLIREDTRLAAHEIRQFGNDMAHGDIEDAPEAEVARDVLVLMDEILAEVFQGPARTARLRGRRTADAPVKG